MFADGRLNGQGKRYYEDNTLSEEGEFEEVVQTETGFNTSESAIGPHQTPTPFKPELDLE